MNRNIILNQVRSHAELQDLIIFEDKRQMEALEHALKQPFQPLSVRKITKND